MGSAISEEKKDSLPDIENVNPRNAAILSALVHHWPDFHIISDLLAANAIRSIIKLGEGEALVYARGKSTFSEKLT
jgi:hypothetical protein